MIIGLTEAASGLGEPSKMPLPGATTRAPKSCPIETAQAAAPPLLSTAANPAKPPESTAVPPAGCCPLQPARTAEPAAGEGAT